MGPRNHYALWFGCIIMTAVAVPWIVTIAYMMAYLGPHSGWLSDEFINVEGWSFAFLFPFIIGGATAVMWWGALIKSYRWDEHTYCRKCRIVYSPCDGICKKCGATFEGELTILPARWRKGQWEILEEGKRGIR